MVVFGLSIFGFGFMGCDNGTGGGGENPGNGGNGGSTSKITYTVTADGEKHDGVKVPSGYEYISRQLTFTFDSDVSGLTKNDITITEGDGQAEGLTLKGSGKVWTLDLNHAVNQRQGNVKVKISKSGIDDQNHDVFINDVIVAEQYRGTYKSQTDNNDIITVEINKISKPLNDYTRKAYTRGTGGLGLIGGSTTAYFEGTTLIWSNGTKYEKQ
jgi:hypothetical protein